MCCQSNVLTTRIRHNCSGSSSQECLPRSLPHSLAPSARWCATSAWRAGGAISAIAIWPFQAVLNMAISAITVLAISEGQNQYSIDLPPQEQVRRKVVGSRVAHPASFEIDWLQLLAGVQGGRGGEQGSERERDRKSVV